MTPDGVPGAREKVASARFHMVKYLGAAVDKVWRQEHRELMKAEAGWPERNQV